VLLGGFSAGMVAQQVIGPTALNDLGYDYGTAIRTTRRTFLLRSFSTTVQPFPFALYVMAVLLLGVTIALTDQKLRNGPFVLATPIYLLGILSAFVPVAWLGLAVGMLDIGFKRYRLLLIGLPIGLIVFLFIGSNVSDPLLSPSTFQARTSG
jgi:hypothetical protein